MNAQTSSTATIQSTSSGFATKSVLMLWTVLFCAGVMHAHVGSAKSKSVSDPGRHLSPDSGCRQEHHSCGCVHKCCHRRCVFVCGALLEESCNHTHLISLHDCIAHYTASCANEVLKLASGYVQPACLTESCVLAFKTYSATVRISPSHASGAVQTSTITWSSMMPRACIHTPLSTSARSDLCGCFGFHVDSRSFSPARLSCVLQPSC